MILYQAEGTVFQLFMRNLKVNTNQLNLNKRHLAGLGLEPSYTGND